MDQAKIGSFLKELRKEKGLTQEQLAEEFGVATRTVSRWENGNNMPDLSILVELADFYDIDIRELISGERKSENMTEDMKDTLQKVAVYSSEEKERILKKLHGCIIVSAIIFIAITIIPFIIDVIPGEDIFLRYSQLRMCLLFISIIGIVVAGSGYIRIMQYLENLNKDKVRKIRRVMLPIILLMAIILLPLLCAAIITMFHWSNTETSNVTDYNKSVILEEYGGDLDSNLSIFPDESLITESNSSYTCNASMGILDTDATIILECDYNDTQYEQEIERLKNLQMTIKHGEEEYTNYVIYDEESYNYPAYITIDGYSYTYEYALLDNNKNRIIYIYLAYPRVEAFNWNEYLKKDKNVYDNDDTFSCFSMYNHTFDGGESYTEFDD